jgi:hypothetical protein
MLINLADVGITRLKPLAVQSATSRRTISRARRAALDELPIRPSFELLRVVPADLPEFQFMPQIPRSRCRIAMIAFVTKTHDIDLRPMVLRDV